jgi:hypothetical protein
MIHTARGQVFKARELVMLTVERIGQRLFLDYPVNNFLNVPLEYVGREIEVESFRNIGEEPISLESFLARPMLRRGEVLVFANESGCSRKYYPDCARGGTLAGLQFVLIDEDEPDDDYEPASRVYFPTVRERRIMLATVDELGSLPSGLTLAVRAVRLE